MAIATLIAAGRLDDSVLQAALRRLDGARLLSWIDEGDAADIGFEGNAAAARARLAGIDGVDFAVLEGDRTPARLLVADMDSTIIGQEGLDELADYAGLKPQVAAITERAMRGELDFAAALSERVALLKGLDAAVVDRCLAERIRANPGAGILVRTMRARGAETVLVSGGFTAFAAPIAETVGFERFVANRLSIRDGKLAGSVDGRIVDATVKREVLIEARARLGLEPARTLAVGDGANDIPMVEEAGLGVGFHPKPALAAVADGIIRHHDLTALLWMQGIPRREWVEG